MRIRPSQTIFCTEAQVRFNYALPTTNGILSFICNVRSSKSPVAVPFDCREGPATPSASPMEPSMHLGLETLLQIVQGGAVPRNVSQENLQTHFPNHAITSFLLSHFFDRSSIHWLWSVIHRPVFDKCYMSFSSSLPAPSLDFLALLALVCASSLQFLPETEQDVRPILFLQEVLSDRAIFQASIFSAYELGRHVLRERLYNFSRSVLIPNDAIVVSLERVQALALLALYQSVRYPYSIYIFRRANLLVE